MIEERHVREEMRNICNNHPLFPGDTISHETANECSRRGWARRDQSGNWIPTEIGLREVNRVPDSLFTCAKCGRDSAAWTNHANQDDVFYKIQKVTGRTVCPQCIEAARHD